MSDYLYKPLTKAQQELADKLTANMDLAFYTEKRDPDIEFHRGILIPAGLSGKPIRVMVTDEYYRADGRILLTHQEFPTVNPAELICEMKGGEKVRIRGWAEATRPGRRAEDKVRKPAMHISFFHPKRVGP